MAVGEYVICEPLRVWNRLEPRARQTDFARALRAEIADPAWMLGRQWQFGEMRGEDTGSPVRAQIATRAARIEATGRDPTRLDPRVRDEPLEACVERETYFRDDLRWRAQLGRRLLEILDDAGARYDALGVLPVFDRAPFVARLRMSFGFTAPPQVSGTSARERVEHLRSTTNPEALALASALAGRGVDGFSVLDALPQGPLSALGLPGTLVAGVHPAHLALWIRALEAFRQWFTETSGTSLGTWVDAQLEHSFAVRVPRPGGGSLVLAVPEYHGGHLDWDAFDLGAASPGVAGAPDTLERAVATMIPVAAEYPGMPNARFWQLEDGAVNLGDLRADTTDVVKVMVAEFALLFGNDWFVFPLGHPVGALVEVEGIVVTDVFGERTLIPATSGRAEGWAKWAFFDLSSSDASRSGDLGPHLFIPPALASKDESDPIEAISLLRDESANLVWAIERTIPDTMGGGRDGTEAARRLALRLAELSPPPSPGSPEVDARLAYGLGTGVPENWIPFLPSHRPLQDRSIRLQRASMPRFAFDTVRPVRPRTRLLRPGLADDDQQTQAYFLHEEEVPRGGVRVETSLQRARWFDGRTHLWVGRHKRSGRGEVSSSLRFDVLEPKK